MSPWGLNTGSGYKLIKGEPALLAGETLVIADTHIGYEGEIRLKGIKLPSLTKRILTHVLSLAEKTSAKRLLILGDLKHTVYGPRGLEWMDIPAFMRRIVEKFDWVGVVPGNHDGDLYAVLPEEVELMDPDGVLLNEILFTHGHKRVDTILGKKKHNAKTVVVGHFHPAVELADDLGYRYVIPVWVKGMLSNSVEILLMPAFNENIGKLIVNNPERISEELRGFLKTGSINLQEAEAYSLDLVLLGKIGEMEA
ncbi:MAG: metallophosphoesterase family protein [Thermoproteota archaeon]